MSDIEYMTGWMTHLKTLQCTKIPVNYGSVFIPNLTHIYGLTSLDLQFDGRCSFKLAYFISAPDLKRLPSSITTLKLTGLEDKELDDLTRREIKDAAYFITWNIHHWNWSDSPDQILTLWDKSEEKLLLKYTMLTFLTNLTSLTLDSVIAFTSRVWRECMIPCCSKLRHLSLSGYSDFRESPQAMIDRINAYRDTREAHLKRSDVDLSVSEFFSSLTHIETISLDDCVCTYGIVQGISALDKNYTIRYRPDTSITLFLNEKLDDFNMTFSNKSEQES